MSRCFSFATALTKRLLLSVCVLGLISCGGASPDERLAAAKAKSREGKAAAAVLELKSLLQEHPEHAESRLYLGMLFMETDDYGGAEKELRRALDLGVEPARVLPALGKALVLQGEARKVLNEISAEATQQPDALAGILAARGLAHLALRQPAEARTSFDKALALKPDHIDARLGQARILAGEGEIDAALERVDRALAASPKAAEALMLRADLLRAGRRVDDARSAYLAVVENHPGHIAALLALTSLAIAANELDEATDHLAVARKVSPGNAMGSYFQALIHFRKGDTKAARDAIGSVLRVAPNHLPSLLVGGAVEFALGSHELAQARLKYVLDRAPSNLYARRLLIASYSRAGQTQRAMELLDPVLKDGTKDSAMLALAGEVHMQIGDYEKAKEYFEHAAKLDPRSPAMRTGLGLSRLAAGEIDLATADLEAASQLDTSRHQADVLLISTHLQRRQFDQALESARSLVKKQPDNPMSYNLLAAAYIGRMDVAAARSSLEKALELQPGYTPAATNLAQLDLQKGDTRAARKRLEDVIAGGGNNAQAYLALALLGPRIDAAPDEIERWLEAARKVSPGSIRPLIMLARFHIQASEPQKALEMMRNALIEFPDDPEVLDLAGQVQLAAGERNRALQTFSRWVAVQPHSPIAAFRMATAQTAIEDTNGAINSLRRALTLRPGFVEAQVLLAEAEARLGRSKEALEIAGQLRRQNARSPLGWIVEGDVQMLEKRLGQAAEAYEKAYALARSGTTAMKLHAALARLGRSVEGERRLEDWLKHHPTDGTARLYLAEAYLKGAKYKSAAEEYELLLTQQPNNIVALNNLAWCYLQVKDNRAIGTAEKALKFQPENPAVIDTLGWILVESGEVARGVRLLGEAVRLSPRSPEVRYHYAQGLMKLGDRQEAKGELERLLVENPTFSKSEEAMKLLTSLRVR